MFEDWSPAQLAHAVGYRIDLRSHGLGNRDAYLISPCGKAHPTGHSRACATLSRLARMKGVDPAAPPHDHPRALVNGQEQNDPH